MVLKIIVLDSTMERVMKVDIKCTLLGDFDGVLV
jgi:hypothetical protein